MDKFLTYTAEHKTLVFYVLLLVAAFLAYIPLIGKYFRTINTLIHETGHSLVTVLLSGEVISVNLYPDTSGTTVTKTKNKFSQALILFSGYVFSALAGFVFMYLIAKERYLFVLVAITSIAMLLVVFSIRNAYGLFWAITFLIINFLLIYFNNTQAIALVSTFYTLVIVTDSVISAIVLLVLSFKDKNKAGDATGLQKLTGIPAAVWAVIFLAVVVFVNFFVVVWFFPPVANLFASL